jgi:histidine ammonia-lyase
VREAYAIVRAQVRPLDGDRSLSRDIEQLRDAVRTGRFTSVGRAPTVSVGASA